MSTTITNEMAQDLWIARVPPAMVPVTVRREADGTLHTIPGAEMAFALPNGRSRMPCELLPGEAFVARLTSERNASKLESWTVVETPYDATPHRTALNDHYDALESAAKAHATNVVHPDLLAGDHD